MLFLASASLFRAICPCPGELFLTFSSRPINTSFTSTNPKFYSELVGGKIDIMNPSNAAEVARSGATANALA